MNQNRISKYLFYAFGEIILVVVGIVIALQVSNWNQERQFQKGNQAYLEKLMLELDLNVERMDFLMNGKDSAHQVQTGLNAIIARCDTAIDYLHSGLDAEKIEWMLNSRLYVASLFNLNNSVYREMQNNGRLNSLGSDTLKRTIEQYHRKMEREQEYARKRNESGTRSWAQCKYGWEDLVYDYQRYGANAISARQWLFQPDSREFKDLKAALYNSRHMSAGNLFRLNELHEQTLGLKALIASELSSKP